MHRAEPPPSYRALLEIPTLGRILLGMSISRIGGSMLGVAIVLFTLERFGSPVLAGRRHLRERRAGAVHQPDRRRAARPARADAADHHRPARRRRVPGADRRAGDGRQPHAPHARPRHGRRRPHRPAQLGRAADPVPDPRPAPPLGARQRARLERLRRGDADRPAARRAARAGRRRPGDAPPDRGAVRGVGDRVRRHGGPATPRRPRPAACSSTPGRASSTRSATRRSGRWASRCRCSTSAGAS